MCHLVSNLCTEDFCILTAQYITEAWRKSAGWWSAASALLRQPWFLALALFASRFVFQDIRTSVSFVFLANFTIVCFNLLHFGNNILGLTGTRNESELGLAPCLPSNACANFIDFEIASGYYLPRNQEQGQCVLGDSEHSFEFSPVPEAVTISEESAALTTTESPDVSTSPSTAES